MKYLFVVILLSLSSIEWVQADTVQRYNENKQRFTEQLKQHQSQYPAATMNDPAIAWFLSLPVERQNEIGVASGAKPASPEMFDYVRKEYWKSHPQ